MPQKKLHRFFIPLLLQEEVCEIRDERLVHQLLVVLRYGIGSEFIVFGEGTDDFVVVITAHSKKHIAVKKQRMIPARDQHTRKLIAAISIIKRDTFELIVQKLTELGVHTIVPIISNRTIKQNIRLERLATISIEAVEQSGRNMSVQIHPPTSLAESFVLFPFPAIIFDPYADRTTSAILDETLCMYIGPEGGWSIEDMELFQKHNTITTRLTATILRTETAAIIGAYELLRNV